MSWDPLATTINVPAVSGSVAGLPRILPGNPAASVIVQLISQRGVLQMPPIATRFVDTTNVAAVEDWIQHMPAGDAGTAAGTPDAGTDGESDAATGADATTSGSGTPDATVTPDAASSGSSDDTGAVRRNRNPTLRPKTAAPSSAGLPRSAWRRAESARRRLAPRTLRAVSGIVISHGHHGSNDP